MKDLWRLFPLDGLGPAPRSRAVGPEEIPEPERALLVHKRHMTVALEERHGARLKLHVLARRRDGDLYARRLFLTAAGRPVLFGIMRIDLAATPPAAREQILAERTPLGAILIAQKVLRRIEPHRYIEVRPTRWLARLLAVRAGEPLYGRLARIHCSGVPAVDLLEVVAR